MSNINTTEWLEFIKEEFETTESGAKRASLIQVLHNNGFHDQADNLYTTWHDKRKLYLEEHGRTEEDIIVDPENEVEYFWVESESGNPNEDDYQNDNVKANVPDELSINLYQYLITHDNGTK